tara:strand:+ start:837 stop:1406 length:570 start_codon:yes stop_codon:yes gene_type:complete
MRIIAGRYKKVNLNQTIDKSIRPLKDSAKEGIFNVLTHSTKLMFDFKNSKILDLFSGTGSFGLECISRGSANVTFVEKNPIALKNLHTNIKKLKVEKISNVFQDDVFHLLRNRNFLKKNTNLIYLDPPFKEEKILEIFEFLIQQNNFSSKTLIILHRNKTDNTSFDSYKCIETKTYGNSKILFGNILSL